MGRNGSEGGTIQTAVINDSMKRSDIVYIPMYIDIIAPNVQ